MNNNTFSYWLTVAVTAAIGVFFIIWHNEVNLASWLIRALGVILVIPAAYVLLRTIGAYRNIDDSGRRTDKTGKSALISQIIVAIATAVVGLWMLFSPGFFVALISYLFACVLLLYGIYQIVLLYMCRPVVMPWFFYIVPVLFIIGGLAILFTTVREINSVVTLITGILLVAAAINSVASSSPTAHSTGSCPCPNRTASKAEAYFSGKRRLI